MSSTYLGSFVASQLKKLPEFNAVNAMQKIQNCLFDERMTVARQPAFEHTLTRRQWEDGFTSTSSHSMVSPDIQEDTSDHGDNDMLRQALITL